MINCKREKEKRKMLCFNIFHCIVESVANLIIVFVDFSKRLANKKTLNERKVEIKWKKKK